VKLLAVARRELALSLRTPAAWLVAALFLAVEGHSFWIFVGQLDRRAAPPSAALRLFFGGSFLFWLLVMVIAVVATMRAVAEERRSGTLEVLLTAPISPLEVILGKYLGALAAFALLWLPTLGFLAILSRLGAPLDGGAVAGGYLGTLLFGAAALAIGLCASSLTEHQLAAAGLALLTLTALLCAGFAADAIDPESRLLPLVAGLQITRRMEAFARGAVDLRAVALHLGLAGIGLALAVVALARPAATRKSRVRHGITLISIAALAVAANLFAARHPRALDLTQARSNTLAPRTASVLDHLDREVAATMLLLPTGSPADPYDEIRALLDRCAARTARFRVQPIGEGDGEAVRALAARYHLGEDQLADGGLLLTTGDRARLVPRPRLAQIERDGAGEARLVALPAEDELAAALVALTAERPRKLCFTRGHGEAAIDDLSVGGMSDLGDALRRAPATLTTLDSVDAGVPTSCDLLVLAGPERPFSAAELAALDTFLAHGHLLALVGAGSTTGLEELLSRRGIALRDHPVSDPATRAHHDESWIVDDGYAAHPITNGFSGHRTVWSQAREVAPLPSENFTSATLVHTTDGTSVAAASERAAGPHLVVLGSKELARNDRDVAYNRDLLVAAVDWLTRDDTLPKIPAAPAPRTTLQLDDAELDRLFWVCAVGIPLLPLFVGAAVWWRRRK
jgi:ABC-2 type transport system permease protein